MAEEKDVMDVGFAEGFARGVQLYSKTMPNSRAKLATALIERWGLVVAKDNGEDSAGRHRITKEEPKEVVARACETADLAFSEFEKRGWMLHIPEPKSRDEEEE